MEIKITKTALVIRNEDTDRMYSITFNSLILTGAKRTMVSLSSIG